MWSFDLATAPTEQFGTRVTALLDRAERELGREPLSDHLRLDLEASLAGRGNGGFFGVLAEHDGSPAGYAQVSAANDGSVLEIVTSTGAADPEALAIDLFDTALDHWPAAGGTDVTWWVDEATPGMAARAADRGLAPHRTLYEMRRPLPHELSADVETRSFRPGVDNAAWLQVNNRAFAAHGEQGGWNADTLAARMNEPWFDADGFRLYDLDGELAAFCWTKVHPPTDTSEEIGEIYVIAVDPDAHGRGLGKQLTLAGLDSMTARGIRTANLYVDADNVAAVSLYERLGFGVHRSRQAFAGTTTDPEGSPR